jgi:uncharacterized membrane protein YqjE
MSEPEPAPERGTEGVAAQVREFLAACAQYASARLRLASIEGREATAHGIKLLLLAAAAIILAAFGWLFLCLGVVFLLSKAFGGPNPWLWSALAMAGAHFLGVALIILGIKSKIETPLFPMTAGELKKDQEWLERQTRTKTQS